MIAVSNFSALVLSLGVLLYLGRTWPASSRLPASINWAGRRNEVFSKARACVREFTAGLRTLAEGYATVCQLHDNFVLSSD